MRSIRHIFFDLDNTLWDFDSNSRETLAEVFIQLDLAGKTTVSSDYFIERYLFHNERYWDLYRQNKVSKSKLRSERFEVALRDVGIDDRPFSKKFANSYMELCPQKSALNEGAVEVLDLLSEDYTLHILSNGFHEVQLVKLKVSGLSDYFDHVITSEKASAKKPNSRIFEFAMSSTGAQPSESLMIGDHVNIDVVGALNSGWQAVHYNPRKEVHGYQSIERLMELPALLGK